MSRPRGRIREIEMSRETRTNRWFEFKEDNLEAREGAVVRPVEVVSA